MDTGTIVKYLEGKLSEPEAAQFELWMQETSANREIVKQHYELMFIGDRLNALNNFDSKKSYENFKKQHAEKLTPRRSNRKILYKKVAAIAAIGILLIASSLLFSLLVADGAAKDFSVSTNLGERAQLTLPDGSRVWLNACSRIDYRKNIWSRKRIAYLEGEGYFEVNRKTLSSFYVQNNTSEIKVLGTSFNVRANSNDSYTEVSLLEGAVSFHERGGASVELKPGERLILDKENHKVTIGEIPFSDDVTAWRQGNLIFNNSSLLEIAKSLERNYNVKIKFTDEAVQEKRFTAEFGLAHNIYQILSILELTNAFGYTFNEGAREITISSK